MTKSQQPSDSKISNTLTVTKTDDTLKTELSATTPEKTPLKKETLNALTQQQLPKHSDLSKWVNLIYNDLNPQAEQLSISLYGMQRANQVLIFLKSIAGKSLIAELSAQMAINKFIEEYQYLQFRERQLLMHRIRASFFLWELEKQASVNEKQKELIIDQNEKAIKNSGKTSESIAPPAVENQKAILKQAAYDYERALKINQSKQNQLVTEQKLLQKQLTNLESEGILIEFKYSVYEAQLRDFEALLIQFEKLGLDESDAEIQKYIEAIQLKMDEYLQEVDDLIRKDQDEEASLLMKMHTALGLKLGSHQDMLDVRKGDKYYLDAEGNAVHSFKEAYFILFTNQHMDNIASPELRRTRIYKDEYNNYYLLEPGQTWDLIKDNTAVKAEAHKNFEYRKQDFTVVNHLIYHTKGLEVEIHKEKVEQVKGKIESNQKQVLLIQNQKILIESSLSQIKEMSTQLEQSSTINPTAPTPKPTITNGPQAPKPGKILNPVQAYKEQLEFFKKSFQVTPEDLLSLANQAPGLQKIAARNFVLSEIVNMPQKTPIPYQTMQSLLKNLERFGVDATKPSVTNIKNETEVRKETEQEEVRSNLSPFSTNPFKI